MVPDDAGPVPYQRVMRPLRGERTISVAKCPRWDLNPHEENSSTDFKSVA